VSVERISEPQADEEIEETGEGGAESAPATDAGPDTTDVGPDSAE
jgi:DNA gyrase subunit A